MKKYAPLLLLSMPLLPALATAGPQEPTPTVSLQVGLSSFQGDVKLSDEGQAMRLEANGKAATVRSGSPVPFQTPNGSLQIQQVGTQIDASVIPAADGRFKVAITITKRSVSDEKQLPQIANRVPGMPLVRNFIIATTLYLADGQTTRITGIDPISNENWQADVTLSVKTSQTPTAGSPMGLPIRIPLALSITDGNRQITSRYTLAGSSSGESSSVRIGTEVPISVSTPRGQTAFTMQLVGSQIDYKVVAAGDGRFTLQMRLTLRTFSGNGEIKNLIAENTQTLRDGEATRHAGTNSAGEPYTVDVTLSVVK